MNRLAAEVGEKAAAALREAFAGAYQQLSDIRRSERIAKEALEADDDASAEQ